MRERDKVRASPEAVEEKSRPRMQPGANEPLRPQKKPILDLQRSAGNQAVARLFASGAIQASLRVSQPGDADEVEADRVADQVVASTNPGTVKRKAELSSHEDEPLRVDVHQSMGSGQPLDDVTRDFMEGRFGRDFSKVTIHTSEAAASSATQIQARAFTAGQRIVFAEGQYAPHSKTGARLLAHELAHVSQNQNAAQSGGTGGVPATKIHRDSMIGKASNWLNEKKEQAGNWIEDKKWAIYRAMIAGLKASKTTNVNMMRAVVPKLPTAFQGAASSIIDVVDFVMDLEISLLLAIVGLAVGFVEGLVGLVTGLVKLAIGFLKMMVDYLVALMGKPDEYKQDVNDFVAAIKGIPPGLKQLIDKWVARYQRASLEEQVLLGGELVGQIEALLATFALAGTKAGQASTLTLRTENLGARMVGQAGAAALERAPAISVTIPAVVPKTLAEAAVVSTQMMAMSAAGSGGGGGKQPPRTRNKAAADRFLREQLRKVSDPKHPLHFLVEREVSPGGKPLVSSKGDPLFEWRKTTRTTESGNVQVGRYQANESGVTVQVGHQGAFASGAPEQFVLEDADLNQLSGQLIESKGAFSAKSGVEIEGVPVDLESAEQWERLDLLPKGTVAKSPKILPPSL